MAQKPQQKTAPPYDSENPCQEPGSEPKDITQRDTQKDLTNHAPLKGAQTGMDTQKGDKFKK